MARDQYGLMMDVSMISEPERIAPESKAPNQTVLGRLFYMSFVAKTR